MADVSAFSYYPEFLEKRKEIRRKNPYPSDSGDKYTCIDCGFTVPREKFPLIASSMRPLKNGGFMGGRCWEGVGISEHRFFKTEISAPE